jgi:hypothetical protein
MTSNWKDPFKEHAADFLAFYTPDMLKFLDVSFDAWLEKYGTLRECLIPRRNPRVEVGTRGWTIHSRPPQLLPSVEWDGSLDLGECSLIQLEADKPLPMGRWEWKIVGTGQAICAGPGAAHDLDIEKLKEILMDEARISAD